MKLPSITFLSSRTAAAAATAAVAICAIKYQPNLFKTHLEITLHEKIHQIVLAIFAFSFSALAIRFYVNRHARIEKPSKPSLSTNNSDVPVDSKPSTSTNNPAIQENSEPSHSNTENTNEYF